MSNIAIALVALGWVGVILHFSRLLHKAAALAPDRALQSLKRPDDLEHYPPLTIFVPARNEARNIEHCLRAALASDYPDLRIVVSDDASTDDTAARVRALAAEDPRVSLTSPPTDELSRRTWVSGKSFVLQQAVERAEADSEERGGWWLFLDADVRLEPDALWRAMQFAKQQELQAFSGSGVYPNPRFAADLLEGMMYTFIFLFMPLRQINDPAAPNAWLNGQFILIDASTYARVGGHAAVKDHAFDDLSFGHHLTAEGVPYRFLPGAQLFRCVNYVGLREATEGWSRLLAGGTPWIGLGRSFFAAVAAELVFVWLLPVLIGILLAVGVLPRREILGVDSLHFVGAQIAFAFFVHAVNRAAMAVPAWRAVLYPISALLALRTTLSGYRARYLERSFSFRGRQYRPDSV